MRDAARVISMRLRQPLSSVSRRLRVPFSLRGYSSIAIIFLVSACEIHDQVNRGAEPYTGSVPEVTCLQETLENLETSENPICKYHEKGDLEALIFCQYHFRFNDDQTADGYLIFVQVRRTQKTSMNHRVSVPVWSKPVALPEDTERKMIGIEMALEENCDVNAKDISRNWTLNAPRKDQL